MIRDDLQVATERTERPSPSNLEEGTTVLPLYRYALNYYRVARERDWRQVQNHGHLLQCGEDIPTTCRRDLIREST